MLGFTFPAQRLATQVKLGQNFRESSRILTFQKWYSSAKGTIAQKSPSKVFCEAGKSYNWCACGLSAKQPFCDGSHKRSAGMTPVKFTPEKSQDYFLCCCKQTNKRPFCDGSHKKL